MSEYMTESEAIVENGRNKYNCDDNDAEDYTVLGLVINLPVRQSLMQVLW